MCNMNYIRRDKHITDIARTHGLRAPSVPKAKLGYMDRLPHWVFIFRKIFTWVGLNYPPRLGPRHRTGCAIGPKGEARIFGLPLESIGVLHIFGGGSPKPILG